MYLQLEGQKSLYLHTFLTIKNVLASFVSEKRTMQD